MSALKTFEISLVSLSLSLLVFACGGDGKSWECQIAAGDDPDSVAQIGCADDFEALASNPPSAAIPGARSVKTVIDRLDENALYFQNSVRYPIHWNFAMAHLSGNGLPLVPDLGQFNLTEYYSPDRRFLLGAMTHYEGPDVWVYEISPYDTADVDMITAAYRAIRDNVFVGDDLYFHPTSQSIEDLAEGLPDDVRVITNDELFAGIDYQPLNLGTSMGRLRFITAAELEAGAYVDFREITVLDAVPNDISVTAGIITQEFQTPLSHINVLSQNRGTPNMALRNAYNHETLRPFDDKWVELTVGPFEWSIREVTQAEADQWWEDHRPDPLTLSEPDLTVTDFRPTDQILDLVTYPALADAIRAAIPAFGGKATNYGGLSLLMQTTDIGAPAGIAIPIYYFDQHMETNGLWLEVEAMLADPTFQGDPTVRDARLAALRMSIENAPLDPTFETMILAHIETNWPGLPIRFRSSTNAEDLGDFTGAGLYTSQTGHPGDPLDTMQSAIKKVWASVWFFRAFEERSYYSINHRNVGMALLVYPSFPDEEANGVALTGNIFDTSGLEPGFYVNVQIGEASVVQPDPGVTSDQFVYYFEQPGQPIVFLGHSSLVPAGETVLTRAQTYALGQGLKAVHDYFRPAYGTGPGFYAMDVEFKFDERGNKDGLVIKQARPHPGWGL